MKSKYVLFYFFLATLTLQIGQIFAQNLSVGLFHTQYVCKDGRAMSWGFDCEGRCGRLGSKSYPGYVNLSQGIKKVSAGGYHSLYLDSLGRVWSSGSNQYGQTGTSTSGLTPHLIPGLDSIIDISAGNSHSLFLRYDGTVYGCGRNTSWQLGDGTNVNKFSPILIPNLDSIVQLSAGADNSLFVRANGDVYGSGSNGGGKIGLGTFPNLAYVPLKVNTLSNIIYVSAGETHSLFLNGDGHAFFAGDNYFGTAGSASTNGYIYYPEEIVTVHNIIKVECKTDLSLFLCADSTVFVCGRFANAYVTNGAQFNNLSIATLISSLSGVTEIGVGADHLIFEIGDSILFSMGDNHSGMLGDGSTIASTSPVLVTNLCGAPLNLQPDIAEIEENSIKALEIFPNPSSGLINMEFNDEIGVVRSIQMLDMNGKHIYEFVNSEPFSIENTFQLDCSSISDGCYFINVITDKLSLSQKILIKK